MCIYINVRARFPSPIRRERTSMRAYGRFFPRGSFPHLRAPLNMTSARGTAFCHPLSALMEFRSPNPLFPPRALAESRFYVPSALLRTHVHTHSYIYIYIYIRAHRAAHLFRKRQMYVSDCGHLYARRRRSRKSSNRSQSLVPVRRSVRIAG